MAAASRLKLATDHGQLYPHALPRFYRPPQPLVELHLRTETELGRRTSRLEAAAGLAVRLRVVPDQLTFEPDQLAYLLGQLADRHLHAGAKTEMPLVRRVGNLIWSNLVSWLSRRSVKDPASGMRVFRREALPRLYPLPDGLNFTPVMSTRAVHEEVVLKEIPIPYQ